MDKMHTSRQFLQDHTIATISTVSAGGQPHGAAIYYVADAKLNIYFLTYASSDKYKHLMKHPEAAITIVDATTQSTVQATGQVSELAYGKAYDEAFRKLAQLHPGGNLSWLHGYSPTDTPSKLLKFTPLTLRISVFKHTGDHPEARVVTVI